MTEKVTRSVKHGFAFSQQQALALLASLAGATEPALCSQLGRPGPLSSMKWDKIVPETALSAGHDALSECARSFFGVAPDFTSCSTWGQAAQTLVTRLGSWPEDIFFLTSGSTGSPTRVRQPFAVLAQEVHALAEVFSGRKRVVGLVPAHHIYGFLFTVLLPQMLDAEILRLPPLPTRDFSQQLGPDDLVVGFPLFWKGLVSTTPHPLNNVHCVTSTGPCPADVLGALATHQAGRVVEVYGSSETGGLGWRDHHTNPYTLLRHWQKQDDETLLRTMPDGSTMHYIFPDTVLWQGNTAFQPQGRKDKAVQVAGINVYPGKIEALIRKHPDVQDCSVRLAAADDGGRLKVFIVPAETAPDEKTLAAGLRSYFSEHLTAPQTPRQITFGTVVPVNAMGKRCDW